ncbi:unnamed protein product [Didymodactylos carnosus]|uniref:Uncharacterized protein n=1 Tax=Didymodactylos carnosus TaxID=1234261 RepID=A0A8S2FGA9_9BILA|nr:unnamed protein product [Didymodactylos carnosus]CAF4252491.1 unnamed protein product [Didymodactylos carnosus]
MAGLTLSPGVYKWDAAASLSLPLGILTLNGSGVYIFQIGSALSTSFGSRIILINGATPGCVFWQVGSSATLGSQSEFSGIIIAYASVVFSGGIHLFGSVFVLNAAVTLISDTINVQASCSLSQK